MIQRAVLFLWQIDARKIFLHVSEFKTVDNWIYFLSRQSSILCLMCLNNSLVLVEEQVKNSFLFLSENSHIYCSSD